MPIEIDDAAGIEGAKDRTRLTVYQNRIGAFQNVALGQDVRYGKNAVIRVETDDRGVDPLAAFGILPLGAADIDRGWPTPPPGWRAPGRGDRVNVPDSDW